MHLLPPTVAALALAFSLSFWGWATVAEVYALNIFLISLVLYLLLRWRAVREVVGWRGRQAETEMAAGGRWLYGAAIVYGLALGNHHVTVLLLAPGIFYLIVTTAGWRFFLTRQALIAGILVLAATGLVYLYLPLRAAAHPLLNWGDPSTLERFWWHVTGKQYRVNLLSSSPRRLLELFWQGMKLWWAQFTPLGLVLAAVGLWQGWRRDRHLAIAGLLWVLLDIAYIVNYDIAQDSDAYYLTTFLVTAVWIGWAADGIFRVARSRWPDRRVWQVAGGTLGLFPLLVLVVNLPRADKHSFYIAADYVHNALLSVKPKGLLLTDDWQLYSPFLYFQHVERLRPDVTAIDVLLLQNRSWYFSYLQRYAPELSDAVAKEIEAFLVQLDRFEHGTLPRGSSEIAIRYQELWTALLETAYGTGRPVYLTRGAVEHFRELGINPGGELIPEGLLFRVYPQGAPTGIPPQPAWRTRGLNDGTVYLDETVRQIRSTYVVMLINRAIYLRRKGELDAAQAAIRLAEELDPSYSSRLMSQ